MTTTSDSGATGLASEKGKEVAEGEKRDNEGGGEEKRRRSRPWKADGREMAESRAEAREEALSVGLRIGEERKEVMVDLVIVAEDAG